MHDMSFDKIGIVRSITNISQNKFAVLLGISRQTLSTCEVEQKITENIAYRLYIELYNIISNKEFYKLDSCRVKMLEEILYDLKEKLNVLRNECNIPQL